MRGGEGVKLANEEMLLRVPNGDTRDPMCHDVMAEGRQRGRDPVRGSLQGREGVANSLSRLAQHSYKPSAFSIQTMDQGDGIYNLPISFIVEANYLHTLPFYLYALSLK